MVVPVSIDTDGDGRHDTCVFTGWRAGEGDDRAAGRVTSIVPLSGCRTRWEASRHEQEALSKAKVFLTCERLAKEAV